VAKRTAAGAHCMSAASYRMSDCAVLDIALDSQAPSRIYLRTCSGFCVTTDGAAHWTRTLFAPSGFSSDVSNYQPGYPCGLFPACPPFASVPLTEPRPFTQMLFPGRPSVGFRPSLLLTALPCAGLHY